MKFNYFLSGHLIKARYRYLLLLLFPVMCAAQKADEYVVKSAYLEKVTRFIEWPTIKNTTKKDTFVIGIVGENPFDNTLHSYFKNQTIKEKTVNIITIVSKGDIEKCDLLFISKSENNNLEKYLKKAFKHNVLTVSDTQGFAEQGVHVNLLLENTRIKLEINYECLKDAGFNVESILLAYAKVTMCNTIQKEKE